MDAVFVTAESALNKRRGGVQLYTEELLDVLRAAGCRLHILTYKPDMRFAIRLRRKLFPRPYQLRVPQDLAARTAECVRQTGSRWIFLNGVHLAPTAESVVAYHTDARICLCSYGLESVDFLHAARAANQLDRKTSCKLGQQLFAEARQRQFIDQVFCLSANEAELERWIGAKRVTWIARMISSDNALEWMPTGDRIGCVATLDHSPNREGLNLFLREFSSMDEFRSKRFRLVGGPEPIGAEFEQRFRNVDYLGPLTETELRLEAASWNCFVHPLFCYACGCSTKLATALSWRIPVITTPEGARGYRWQAGNLPMAIDAKGLAELAAEMFGRSVADRVRLDIDLIISSAPAMTELAGEVRAELDAFC